MEYTYDQIIALGMSLPEPEARFTDKISPAGSLTESFVGSDKFGFLGLDIEAMVEKKVKEEVALILGSQGAVQQRIIPLKEARAEVYNFLKKQLSEKKKTVNIFDISMSLHLPGNQIEKVMSSLSRKGKVKRI